MLDEVTTVKVMSKTNNSANIDHKQETMYGLSFLGDLRSMTLNGHFKVICVVLLVDVIVSVYVHRKN